MGTRLVLAVVAVLGSPIARAEPAPPGPSAWTTAHVDAAAHAGLGGPLGMLGFELELAPIPWLSVAAGYGTNRGFSPSFGGSSSYSIAAAVRGHAPVASGWSIVAGVGASRGNWTVEDHPLGESPYGEAKWNAVSWLDLDVGVEHHWRQLAVRLYLGNSRVLAKHGYTCEDLRNSGGECPYMMSQPDGNGYLGFAVAYAFAL